MAVGVKICGLTDPAALAAAVEGGARWLGFVFYPPSPRALSPERAGDLARAAPHDRITVGVFVDPDDALLDRVLARVPLAACSCTAPKARIACRQSRHAPAAP